MLLSTSQTQIDFQQLSHCFWKISGHSSSGWVTFAERANLLQHVLRDLEWVGKVCGESSFYLYFLGDTRFSSSMLFAFVMPNSFPLPCLLPLILIDMSNVFLAIASFVLLTSLRFSSDVVIFFHYSSCVVILRTTCPSNFFDIAITELNSKFGLLGRQLLKSTCGETLLWLGKVYRKSSFLLINIVSFSMFAFVLYCLGCIFKFFSPFLAYYLLLLILSVYCCPHYHLFAFSNFLIKVYFQVVHLFSNPKVNLEHVYIHT